MNRLVGVAVILMCLAFSAGCRQKYRFIAVEDIEQRKPFKALVADNYVTELPSGTFVMIALKTESGERIALGNPPTSEIAGFAKSLQKGRTYEFPKVWLDYKVATNRIRLGN